MTTKKPQTKSEAFLFYKKFYSCFAIRLLPEVSLIIDTQNAPIINNTPATTNMFTSGGTEPSTVNILNIHPPAIAATICGTQIVPLNSPRYVPMCPPDNAFVSIVNGNANIAAHAQPINRNDTNNKYWSWMK